MWFLGHPISVTESLSLAFHDKGVELDISENGSDNKDENIDNIDSSEEVCNALFKNINVGSICLSLTAILVVH